jgi:hypothetical protein
LTTLPEDFPEDYIPYVLFQFRLSMNGVYKRTQVTMKRVKDVADFVQPASTIEVRKEQKFITITFVVKAEVFLQPDSIYTDKDVFNTVMISTLMEQKLTDLNNRDNDIWADYEIGNDFLCDYLNCQSASISLYYISPEKQDQFEQAYATNKRVFSLQV